MKRALLIMLLMLSTFPLRADDTSNQKLADVMLMLVDQSSGLATFAKTAPATLDEKAFTRARARTRGAVYLLGLIKEKKGTAVDGVLVPGELTAGKLTTVTGDELVALLAHFDDVVSGVQSVFVKIDGELAIQSTKAPEERDFRALKLLLAELDGAIKKAHEEFRPPHRLLSLR